MLPQEGHFIIWSSLYLKQNMILNIFLSYFRTRQTLLLIQSNINSIFSIYMEQEQPSSLNQLQAQEPESIQPEVVNGSNSKTNKEQVRQPRLKSQLRVILIGLIISISAIMLGYGIKQITSVPKEIIVEKYHITAMGAFEAQSLLIGALPMGSVVGVILSANLIKKFRRLAGIYIFTLVNIGAVILINLPYLQTLAIGRFIQGISIGVYAYIAPTYLKEIAPKELRRLLGLFFSLGKIVGVMVVIVIELILNNFNVEISYRIILSMTGVFSVLQSLLIFFFGSDTPTEMLEKDDREGAMKIIRQFYLEQHVDEIFREYVQEYKADMHQGEEDLNSEIEAVGQQSGEKENAADKGEEMNEITLKIVQEDSGDKQASFKKENQVALKSQTKSELRYVTEIEEVEELTFKQKKFRAYLMAVQMCVVRQFCGGNVLLIQGGQFVKTFNPTLGYYTPVIINSIQFLFILIGIFYIQKVMGKRSLFMFSLPMMIILNLGIVVGMIYEQILATMILMSIFMMVYGGAFININWAIPPELVPARQLMLPNAMHWLTLAIANLVPPLVSKAMPHNNPYPVFIFFALYNTFAYIHISMCLRETDGKTFMQIVKSFK